MIPRLIKSLDSVKATGLDKVLKVVLKNLSLELFPILLKLMEKSILSLWQMLAVFSIYKNAGEHSWPSQYKHISLLNVFNKFFESVINMKIVDHLNRKNLLRDKQYVFHSSRSNADVLTLKCLIINSSCKQPP